MRLDPLLGPEQDLVASRMPFRAGFGGATRKLREDGRMIDAIRICPLGLLLCGIQADSNMPVIGEKSSGFRARKLLRAGAVFAVVCV